MGKDQDRDKDEAANTKSDGDKKLTDLTTDEKGKDVKGGGGKGGVWDLRKDE